MKTEAPSVRTAVSVFPCAVCGAQLDLQHVEVGNGVALCTFCGARQTVALPASEPDPSAAVVAPSDVGDTLREARQARGESLEQVARATRVRESYLRALEEDEQSFDPYPGRVYARFFLREYAEYLGLDPQPLLRRFDHDALPALTAVPPASLFRRPPRPKRWAIAALVLLVTMLVSAAVISRNEGGPGAAVSSSPGGAASAASPRPPRSGPPPVTGIDALIAVAGPNRCWVKVTADGVVVFERVLENGERQRVHADASLNLTLGSAGAARLVVNGRAVPTGSVGQVQRFGWAVRHGRLVPT